MFLGTATASKSISQLHPDILVDFRRSKSRPDADVRVSDVRHCGWGGRGGGAAPCVNPSSPVAATVPLIPFLLFIYDVSGLQITSVPIATFSHNKYL